MTKDEALKLALGVLERLQADFPCKSGADRIAIIKEVLAQQEQEPLEYWNAVEGWVKIDEVRKHFGTVSCGTIYKTAGEGRVPLYTAPPQREPLTDEQIQKIWDVASGAIPNWSRHIAYARAIEAAHGIKEKNT